MTLILVLFCFISLWIIVRSFIHDKVSKRVIYCFIFYWIISLSISTFNPYNLYAVSTKSYVLLLLNVFSITIGYCTVGNTADFSLSKKEVLNFDIIFKSKIFWIMYIVILIFGINTFRTQYTALMFYTTGNLKLDPMGLLFHNSKLQYYFFNLICTPYYYACMALFSYCILYERSRYKSEIALLLLVLVYSFIGGGRVSVFFIAFYLMMFYFWGDRIQKSNNKIKQINISIKTIILSIIFAGILIFGMVFVTAVGQTGLSSELDLKEAYNSLINQFIIYSIGSFRAFDYALQHPDTYFSDYCFGRASLCGLDYLLSLIGGVVGIHFTPINYQTLSVLQNNTIPIGHEQYFNYAYTNAIYAYYDFGGVGIVVIGFIMGRFFRRVIWLCYKKSSIAYFIMSCFTFYILMHTVFSNYFNKNYTVPFILILYLLGTLKLKK